jgi:hypothetical protein
MQNARAAAEWRLRDARARHTSSSASPSPSTRDGMGKITKQKLPKQGHRGRLGVSGVSAHRAVSRKVSKPPIVRERSADYAKFEKLKADVEQLAVHERSGWNGLSASEAKAKAKELKLLRGKLEVKQKKRGA